MRKCFCLFLWIAAVAINASAGVITYDVSGLGGNAYRYTYAVSGISFLANEELDIQFDAALYGSLSNATAPSGFDVSKLFQPNTPPGSHGDYNAFTAVANPSPSGVFSVAFLYFGQGLPGSQQFSINHYDTSGVKRLYSYGGGWTVPADQSGVPEPASVVLAGVGLAAGLILRRRIAVRR